MITLEINEHKYIFPNEWIDITIGQLQQMTLIDTKLNEIDKMIEIINILSGIDKELLLSIPATEYTKMCSILNFINSEIPDKLLDSWQHENITYKLNLDITKMSTAEYLDMDNFSKTSDPMNLHILMAIIYRPEDEVKYNSDSVHKRAELFKQHMPISVAIGAQVFMEVFEQISSNVSVAYSQKQSLVA